MVQIPSRRSRFCLRTVLCTCQLALSVTLAGAPVRAQEPPSYDGPLRGLVYSDARISDADRAQLAHLVADLVPRTYWRPARVGQGVTLDKLVDCYYDAYTSDARTKLTAEALQAEIRAQQPLYDWPLTETKTVMMPPFPAMANRQRDSHLPNQFRVYDALKDGYATTIHLADFSPANVQRVVDEPLITPDSKCPGRLKSRAATNTAVVVPVDDGREKILHERQPRSVSEVSYGPDTKLGQVRVQLLADWFAPCLESANYLTQSPFWADLKTRVAQIRSKLLDTAKDFPLRILDQNFSGDQPESEGHGFKVHKVAKTVLAQLEIPGLADYITDVELCPTSEQEIKQLEAMVAAVPTPARALGEALKKEAAVWLAARGRPCVGDEFDVPDLVLAAVLRRELATGRWLNMSFRVSNSAEPLLTGAFASSSVSIVAAGNDLNGLDGAWIPQAEASGTQRVILVTYGDDKGVYGTFSNADNEGFKVDVIAPGCGIGETWSPGSSFASPLVAVGVWLKELMRRAGGGAPFDNRDLRSQVTAASRPSSAIGRQVVAAGVFDFSRYVVVPLRHVFFRDVAEREGLPRVAEVVHGKFSARCGGGPPVGHSGSANESILHTLLSSPDGTSLMRRELGVGSRHLNFVDSCPLTAGQPDAFELTLTYADGQKEVFDWQKFTRLVMEVSF